MALTLPHLSTLSASGRPDPFDDILGDLLGQCSCPEPATLGLGFRVQGLGF